MLYTLLGWTVLGQDLITHLWISSILLEKPDVKYMFNTKETNVTWFIFIYKLGSGHQTMTL
jgi:hypothetical protein